jgi:hypothetical protein
LGLLDHDLIERLRLDRPPLIDAVCDLCHLGFAELDEGCVSLDFPDAHVASDHVLATKRSDAHRHGAVRNEPEVTNASAKRS